MTKRALLTGVTGFIGKWLPAMLLEAGYEVHILSRESKNRKPVMGAEQCVWHRADLLSSAPWDDDVRKIGASHLLHLAWCSDQSANLESPQNIVWVDASLRLAQAFSDGGGRRLVAGGSCAEYQWSGSGTEMNEDRTALEPATLYGKSKLALHRSLMETSPELSLAWARIFIPYGPDDYPRRLVSYVVGNLLRGEVAACSEGLQVLDFIYVEDVAKALVRLLDGSVVGAVNIGSGEGHSVRQVVECIADVMGRPDLVTFGARAPGLISIPRLVADVVRLRKDVGFQPDYGLTRGIRATIEQTRADRGL